MRQLPPGLGTNTFCIVFLLVHCSLFAVRVSSLGGNFQVKVMSFKNDKGTTYSGSRCSHPPGADVATSPTSSACRTYFRFCLSHYQSKINYSNCSFGSNYSPVYRNDSLFFSTSDAAALPFQADFNFSFAWPGDFSLTIEAWNYMENDRQEWPTPGPSDELIFRYSESFLQQLPSGNWSYKSTESDEQQLIFTLRVLCETNYYDPRCSTVCRPKDDQYGHYECDPNSGSKICLDGWEGYFCQTAKCKNCVHGTCESPNNCSCQSGWRGSSCNDCIPSTQCNPQHGFCDSPGGCLCRHGWGGESCNLDLQYCSNHPDTCKNGGVCLNEGSKIYTCLCSEGYAGENCTEKKSSPSPCQGGTCPCSPGQVNCLCPAGCSTYATQQTFSAALPGTISTTTTTTTTVAATATIAASTGTENVTDRIFAVTDSPNLSINQKLILIICVGVSIPIIIMILVIILVILVRRRRLARMTAAGAAAAAGKLESQQNNQNSRIYNKTNNCEVVIRNDCSTNPKNLNLLSSSTSHEKTVVKTAPPLSNPRLADRSSVDADSQLQQKQNVDKYNKNLKNKQNSTFTFDNSYPKNCPPSNFLPSLTPVLRLDNFGASQGKHNYKSVVVSLEPHGSPTKSPKRHDFTIPQLECFPPGSTDFNYVSSLSSDNSSVVSCGSVHSADEKIESTIV